MPRNSLSGYLPQCQGPKLRPFPHSSAPIEFLRLISANNTETTPSGGHSHVFEVSIHSQLYALKIFKFFDDTSAYSALHLDERDLIPRSIVNDHMDPFYNECRAYGRLIQKKVNGKVAARCYGYLTLSAVIEAKLKKKFGVVVWDRPRKDYTKPVSKRQPFRAIVKELILDDRIWTEKITKKMLKDLWRMRQIGIYPMDVHARNYKRALLIDFSVAITEPHYLFVIKPLWRVEEDYKLQDLYDFDEMMKDEGVAKWECALGPLEYRKKLRSYRED